MSNPPPVTITSEYKWTAFFMVVVSAMSVSINSIYINTYIKRKNIPFKDILTKQETNMLWTTLGFCCANILYLFMRLLYKWKDSSQKVCPSKKQVKEGNEVKNVLFTRADMLKQNCDKLRECANYKEAYESHTAALKQGDFCTQAEYGTKNIMFFSLTVTALCLTTCIILILDIKSGTRQDLTHLTNPSSDSNFIMTLVFAILSGFIPVVLLTYAYAVSATIGEGFNVVVKEGTKTEGAGANKNVKLDLTQEQIQQLIVGQLRKTT